MYINHQRYSIAKSVIIKKKNINNNRQNSLYDSQVQKPEPIHRRSLHHNTVLTPHIHSYYILLIYTTKQHSRSFTLYIRDKACIYYMYMHAGYGGEGRRSPADGGGGGGAKRVVAHHDGSATRRCLPRGCAPVPTVNTSLCYLLYLYINRVYAF